MTQTIRDLVRTAVQTVPPHTTLGEAADAFHHAPHATLVLVEDEPRGIFGRSDLLAALRRRLPESLPLAALAGAVPPTLAADESPAAAHRILLAHRARRLVVVEGRQRILGALHDFELAPHLPHVGLAEVAEIRFLMRPPDRSIGVHTALGDALEQLRDPGCEYLLLVDAQGRPSGTLTPGALLQAYRRDPEAAHQPVGRLLEGAPACLPLDAPPRAALECLRAHPASHLIVTGPDGESVGLLARSALDRLPAPATPAPAGAKPDLGAPPSRAPGLQAGLRRVVEKLAANALLPQHSLPAIAELAETLEPGARVAILTLHEGRLAASVSTHAPSHTQVGMEVLRPAVRGAPSARAVALRERIVCPDLQADPDHAAGPVEAAPQDARACWAQPILGTDGSVLGCFTLYLPRTGAPSPVALEHLESCAWLAGVALEHARSATTLALERKRLQTLVDTIPDQVFIKDTAGVFVGANRAFADFLGIAPHTVIGRSDEDFVPRAIADVLRSRDHAALAAGAATLSEERLRGPDGTLRDFETLKAPVFDDAGQPRGIVGVSRDISHRRNAEAQQRLAAIVFTNSYDGILVSDPHGLIVDVNRAFERITGYTREEVIGRHTRILKSGLQNAAFYAAMWAALNQRGHWQGELSNRRKDDSIYVEKLSISAVHDDAGAVTHFVATFSDVTALKDSQRKLEQLAHYDPLTRLPNRVLLADRMQHCLERTLHRGESAAVCYLDLDGFKPINDRYGHHAGDHLLVELARRLQSLLREDDTAARLGGDEFVLVLTGLPGRDALPALLQNVLDTVAQPFVLDSKTHKVSASIGVTLFPADGADPDTLLRHADQAMYTAKGLGRAAYHLFDPAQDERQRERQRRIDELEAAVGAGALRLHYQPKLDLRSGRVVGMEALIRWQHPQRGLLLPADFLPLLEHVPHAQLARRIDRWVVATALAEQAAWHAAGAELQISVNLGPGSLQDPDFPDWLAERLREHPELPPHRLELEVLESIAFDDVHGAGELIARCARLGVGVALDDFGTGYSSLTYFRRLPAQVIKVDISFITGMLHNSEDLAIVESVLGLAKAFGRTVVAEGVEQAEQAQLLRQMECDYAQGFGISPPLPAEAVLPWLAGFALSEGWKPAVSGAQQGGDLRLLAVELAHRQWLQRVLACSHDPDEAAARPPELHPERCNFGRWLRRDALHRYGSAPLLEQIARHHAALHFTAGDLLQFVQGRAPAERLEALRERLETQSRKLVQDIRQLRALTAAEDHRATRRAPANT